MDEQTWLACEDSHRMLSWLAGSVHSEDHPCEKRHPLATDRKLRLWACACCRQVWDQLLDSRSRRAVEVAEQFADGEATEEEWLRAGADAGVVQQRNPALLLATAIGQLLPQNLHHWVDPELIPPTLQAALIREVVGNPWREMPCLKRGPHVHLVNRAFSGCGKGQWQWLTHADGLVVKLAAKIYQERDGELLPMLADALEDGGADNRDILDHCRQLGVHVRGCWVVDLLLGKA